MGIGILKLLKDFLLCQRLGNAGFNKILDQGNNQHEDFRAASRNVEPIEKSFQIHRTEFEEVVRQF